MVHSACAVYMPLPSADKQRTRRSGHATAAPTAKGRAIPIDPPVLASQSCGGQSFVAAIIPHPEVIDSSTTMALSGRNAATAVARAGREISPTGAFGRSTLLAPSWQRCADKAVA